MSNTLVKERPLKSAFNYFFPSLESWALGFDRDWHILDDLKNTLNNGILTYPQYNIKECGNNVYELEMAVAGYAKKDLKVELKNNRLIIEGNHETRDKSEEDNYVYRGIASRHFRQSFELADHVKVSDSELKDGILKITLKGNPERENHQMIEIH